MKILIKNNYHQISLKNAMNIPYPSCDKNVEIPLD